MLLSVVQSAGREWSRDRDPRPVAQPGPAASAAAARTVLVVDDEPTVRRLVRRVLEGAGYLVLEATDGEAALRLLDARPVALVITDVLMPGQDGIEVVLGMRARPAPVPVVVMSGGGTGLDIETLVSSAIALGAAAALAKPFSVAELLAVVRETLGEEPSAPAAGGGGAAS